VLVVVVLQVELVVMSGRPELDPMVYFELDLLGDVFQSLVLLAEVVELIISFFRQQTHVSHPLSLY